LKTKFKPYGIKNIKQKQGKKHHTCSSPSKYFFSFSYQLLFIIKTIHFLIISQSTYLISLGLNCLFQTLDNLVDGMNFNWWALDLTNL
jgi:hypothetical protein